MRHVLLEPDTAYIVQASHDVLDAPFSQLVDWLRAGTNVSTSGHNDEDI